MPLIMDALGRPDLHPFARPAWWQDLVDDLSNGFSANGIIYDQLEILGILSDNGRYIPAEVQNWLLHTCAPLTGQTITEKAYELSNEMAMILGGVIWGS